MQPQPNACVHRAEKAAATTARKTPPIFTAAFSARVQHIVSSIVLSSYVCRSFTYALMLFSQEITREFSCMSVNLMNDVTSDFYCTETPRRHFPHATRGKEAIKAKKYVASCVWYNLYHASRVAGRNTSSLFKMA